MSIRRILAVALALLAGAACSGSKTTSVPSQPLAVTVSAATVMADGTKTVTVHVANAAAGAVALTTTRGTFQEGTRTTAVQGPASDAVLTTCDATLDASCQGTATITATDAALRTASAQVSFLGAEVCNNGVDDNGDGLVDCQDSACDSKACVTAGGVAGTCQALTCVAPVCAPTASSETNCQDGLDNDCNGTIDCLDSACDGQACKAGSPTFRCQSQKCVDMGSGYGLSITPARARIPADGKASTLVTLSVSKSGSAAANATVNLSTTLGTLSAPSVQTDSTGKATVLLTSDENGGIATITGTVAQAPLVSMTATVAMPLLGSITVVPVTAPVLGAKYSGFNEQIPISVLLLDTNQQPYPDGLAVRFEHQQLGGSEISKPFTADTSTCTAATHCLGYLGATASTKTGKADSDGLAAVNLYSGTVAGPVAIKVTATAGGLQRSYVIQNLAVVGAKASGAQVSIDCTPKNLPALMDTNCTQTFYAKQDVTCTAYFADRFGNVLGVPTLATFRSEAGAAGQPVTTTAYDPSKGTDQTSTLGFAKNTVLVGGYGLPLDVEPFTGEPSHALAAPDACGVSTRNPRDGLVTILVAVKGEEGFVDLNGNGIWDQGEPFVDQGEPYLDENDNGVHDANEPYIDVNGNGLYDGPNGKWDADTTIWAETRVLYTGLPDLGVSTWSAATFSVAASPATSKLVSATLLDPNLNILTSGASFAVSSVMQNASATIVNGPITFVDSLGMGFSQLYCSTEAPTTLAGCSATCQTSPCYRVSTVSGFSTGDVIPVLVTGAKAGGETVDLKITVDGIYEFFPLNGTVN
ncbi:Ig-like domain-containing protein [Anaeromyxobacter paludicola]|uniref:Big-1 domain-containing protein n=1 Tax=Anaeromyxobacter paludicola TaxID=2918171 RepID=A0ABN6NDA8_9BACT|nr:Ig-like domain-containing protein [Anaeromyxobacter paludicola]BDG10420.1 hypothetical protein AMPC_35330 [Anaeromyxobacter paludicola]